MLPQHKKEKTFLKNDGHLDTETLFGCHSDWPEMLRYTRQFSIIVTYFNEKAIVKRETIINSRPISVFIWNTIKNFSFGFIQLVNPRQLS